MPKSEDLSRSLEINAIWKFDTEFPTIFNKSCTYITFKSAVKHRQLSYGYPRGQTVHLAEATTHTLINHGGTLVWVLWVWPWVFPEFRVFTPQLKITYIYKDIVKICLVDIFRIFYGWPLSSLMMIWRTWRVFSWRRRGAPSMWVRLRSRCSIVIVTVWARAPPPRPPDPPPLPRWRSPSARTAWSYRAAWHCVHLESSA